MALTTTPLVPGQASGPVLRLDAPISFWGGVDPASGRIVDPRHPQSGADIAKTVLLVPSTVGSSSSSSVLLELITQGRAPAALVLGKRDAIVCLGAIVAQAMGWQAPPIVELSAEDQCQLHSGTLIRLTMDGTLQAAPEFEPG
jgi:predicted aconitase with swiveling domain